MGYSVYWANDRWQGYGVPAYCDVVGCKHEIDRGMGYQHSEDDEGQTPNVFCCEDHKYTPLNNLELDNNMVEAKEWLEHILNDDSWTQWRVENEEQVAVYREYMEGLT